MKPRNRTGEKAWLHSASYWRQTCLACGLHCSQHLTSDERLALFQSCNALASLVVKHCHKLTLQPAKHLQSDSKRRAYVLGVAAGCSNIHLRIEIYAVTLDTPAIWPCITQITASEQRLNRLILSRLHVLQLTSLHSLHLARDSNSSYRDVKSLDADVISRLQKAVETGGLSALRSLGGDYNVLCKLAPVLGAQTSHLVLEQSRQLSDFKTCWPVLQQVEVQSVPNDKTGCMQLLQQLLTHPTVKQVKLPSSVLKHDCRACQPPAWDSLEFTGSLSALLQNFPLQCVRQLRLPYQDDCITTEACEAILSALQGLDVTTDLVLTSGHWGDSTGVKSSVVDSMPTVALSFHPSLLNFMFTKVVQWPESFILDGMKVGHITVSPHLVSLAKLPAGIHTLAYLSFVLDGSCPWVDVMANIPARVQHLLIADCVFTEDDWEDILDHPAPLGLRVLTLASDKRHMSWVPLEGGELTSMQGLVTSKWPNVRLEVDTSRGPQFQLGSTSGSDDDM